jgi:hypothetical protein
MVQGAQHSGFRSDFAAIFGGQVLARKTFPLSAGHIPALLTGGDTDCAPGFTPHRAGRAGHPKCKEGGGLRR